MNFLPGTVLGSTQRGVTEVGIRPEHVKLAQPRKGTKNLAGTIQLVERLGNATAIHVETPAGTVTALTGPESDASAGTETGIIFDTRRMIGFDAEGKATIFGIR
jgi:ABC-type sugar transport system ATPase subunit